MMRSLLAGALLVPVTAFAQGQPYFGVGLFNWNYDEDYVEEASASGVRFTLGNELNDNLSIEAQLAMGGSDEVSVPGYGSADVELDSLFSAMVRPHTAGEDVRAYGLLGFSMGEMTASVGEYSASEDESGLSYGAGVEAALTDDAWVSLEYVNYLRDEDFTFDAVTIGTRLEF